MNDQWRKQREEKRRCGLGFLMIALALCGLGVGWVGQAAAQVVRPFTTRFTVTTTKQLTDLSIAKTASPNPVVAGQNLTYTLTVTNAGPGVAMDTVVTDAVPASTSFVSASAPAGWTIAAPPVGGTGIVTFSNPALAVSVTSLTLVVQVDAVAHCVRPRRVAKAFETSRSRPHAPLPPESVCSRHSPRYKS